MRFSKLLCAGCRPVTPAFSHGVLSGRSASRYLYLAILRLLRNIRMPVEHTATLATVETLHEHTGKRHRASRPKPHTNIELAARPEMIALCVEERYVVAIVE